MSRRHIAAVIASLCLIGPSNAAFQIDQVNIGCTGDLMISGVNALSMHCSGDLSLHGTAPGAFIEASESIHVFSLGQLSVADLHLISPFVELLSDSAVVINGNISLLAPPGTGPTGPDLYIGVGEQRLSTAPETAAAGTISIGPRGDIRLSDAGIGERPGIGVRVLDGGQLQVSAVPEPSTWALLMGGMGLMAFVRRRGARA